jgi:hypothetical protein
MTGGLQKYRDREGANEDNAFYMPEQDRVGINALSLYYTMICGERDHLGRSAGMSADSA